MFNFSPFIFFLVFAMIGLTVIACFLIIYGGIVRFRSKELMALIPFHRKKKVDLSEEDDSESESIDVREYMEEDKEKRDKEKRENKRNNGKKKGPTTNEY